MKTAGDNIFIRKADASGKVLGDKYIFGSVRAWSVASDPFNDAYVLRIDYADDCRGTILIRKYTPDGGVARGRNRYTAIGSSKVLSNMEPAALEILAGWRISPGTRIDVGCGVGQIARPAALGARVTGLDIATTSLALSGRSSDTRLLMG